MHTNQYKSCKEYSCSTRLLTADLFNNSAILGSCYCALREVAAYLLYQLHTTLNSNWAATTNSSIIVGAVKVVFLIHVRHLFLFDVCVWNRLVKTQNAKKAYWSNFKHNMRQMHIQNITLSIPVTYNVHLVLTILVSVSTYTVAIIAFCTESTELTAFSLLERTL